MPLDFPNSPTNGQTFGNYYFDSSVGTSGAWRAQPIPVGGLPAGSIIQWGSNTAPSNWLICDGSAVSRSVYPSLFAAIGTQYGAGDGSTTFNLPDLRGRVAVGRNSGTFGTLGAKGGAETHTLTEAEMPTHTHPPAAPYVAYVMNRYPTTDSHNISGGGGYQNPNITTTGPAGGGQAHNNLQPYLVTNYIIKATAGWTAGDSELATRVGVLEAAPAGLVRVVPASIGVGTGTASVNSSGIVTFTGSTFVSLNSIFSSTFRNYLVVWNMTSGSSDTGVFMHFRSGTTDRVSGYNAIYQETSGGAFTASGGGSQIGVRIGRNSAGLGSGGATEIYSPFLSNEYSRATSRFHDSSFGGLGSGVYPTLESHAGITISSSTTVTMTGTIQVYGYRN